MVQMEGKYAHEKNENLDDYYKAVGIPLIPRKLMCSSSPSLEIKKDDEGQWTITFNTLLKTTSFKFKIGEEYEEHMPGGVIKSTTNLEDDKLVTNSVGPDGSNFSRIYKFSDTHCIINMKHEKSGNEATRHFKKL